MRISFFAPCASSGLPSPARAVAATVRARNSRREDPDLLCLLMIDLPYALLLELQKQLSELSRARSSKSCANKLAKPIPAAIDGHHRFSVTCRELRPRVRHTQQSIFA